MAYRASMTRQEIWVKLLLYPTHTLPTAAAPVLVGVGLALHNRVFSFLPAFIGFVASWLVHVGGVFTDNYELLTHHSKIREHPELVEAVENGTLSLGTLRGAIALCWIVPVLAGPYLFWVAGPPVVAFGALGILASWSYSGRPIHYAKLGIADLVFFVVFGVLAVAGIYYVQAAAKYLSSDNWYFVSRALPSEAFVVGWPIGALVTNVLLIDDIRDRIPDQEKGWRTPTVRFGSTWTRSEIIGFGAFAYAVLFWFWLSWGFTPWVLLPFLTLPWAISVLRTVWTCERPEQLNPMTSRASFLALFYAALLAAGIAVH